MHLYSNIHAYEGINIYKGSVMTQQFIYIYIKIVYCQGNV